MITSSEATFRALLSSSIADDGERERLAAELARASEVEVMREKSQLAASLHQEIRAPLNSIIATAEQLRRSGLDLAQREHAEALAASAQALLCLVTDLLDVSKADTERLAPGAAASVRPGGAQLDPVHAPTGPTAPFAQSDGAERKGGGDVLDEAILAQLKGTLTPSMCRHLLEEFEASLPRFLVDIESAFERQDAAALRHTAHLLRGSSATLGAIRLSDACARLERTREEDPPVGEQQLAQLREALEEACLALRERLA